MHLKRLELMGFKSFASRVTLDFDKGITAIVGPNGSGKSNISDAIRWVLGEQSARTLRGTKMEDVIFAGTDGKKPLGMAEVVLTVDNTDQFLPLEFSEVSIARRVYRSGESQFLINKRPCRLKDIHDLFTDTGIGREGFAVMNQSQIDAVLSTRSQDRRILLEETAGIVKYRVRKEEAVRKLERVEHDTARVKDILAELTKRLAPLQRESEKAMRYQKLADRLHTAELDYYGERLRELQGRGHRAAAEYEEAQNQNESLNQQLQTVESQVAAADDTINQLELDIEGIRSELSRCSERVNEEKNNENLTNERRRNLCAEQQRLETQIEQYLREEQADAAANEDLQQQARAKDLAYRQGRAAAEKAAAALRQKRTASSQLAADWEQQRSDFVEFLRALAEQRNQARSLEQEERSQGQRLSSLDEMLQERRAEHRRLEIEKKSTQKTQTDLERAHETLAEQMAASRSQLASLQDAAAAQARRTAKQEQQLQDRKAKVQALRDLERNYQGHAVSVRRLLTTKPSGIELLGTVADVIQVKPGWELAVETALGAGIGFVLTTTKADAQNAIAWLKEQQAGRATFLPIDSMKANSFPQSWTRYWNMPGVLGPALDALQITPQCRTAVASLLGRVVLVDTLETGLALQKKLPSFHRIVSREGDVLSPSGAMTGGRLKGQTAGLLSRRRELDTLTEQQKQLQADLDAEKENTRAAAAAADAMQTKLRELEAAEQDNRSLALQNEREITRLEQQCERSGSSLSTLERQRQSLTHQLKSLISEGQDAQKQAAAMENEEEQRRQALAVAERQTKDCADQLERLQEALTQAKIDQAQLQSENDHIQRQRALAAEKKNHWKQKKDLADQELQQVKQRQQQLAAKAAELIDKIQVLQAEKQALQNRLSEKNELRRVQLAKLQELRSQEKTLRRKVSQAERRLHQKELLQQEVQLGREQIEEEVRRLETSLAALLERSPVRDTDELAETIKQLKDAIKGLGVINPAAVEEYNDVTARHKFLSGQHQDLQDARETLTAVISEMDQTSEQRFREAFRQVRREFRDIFGQLFSGGHADLVLTDPENPLTTGVEVMAQPSGKKFQNLLLLSGGERSLTATALMFALRSVKPAPFCVLDEIDAPLDAANLNRFAAMMKRFAETTQFLVITHRITTMEAADVLYGVTMEKSSASQLMSVKLA